MISAYQTARSWGLIPDQTMRAKIIVARKMGKIGEGLFMLCVCSNNGCVLYNEPAGLAVLDIQGRLKTAFRRPEV